METTLKIEGEVVAFVDIGTNSVRLLVVRINPNFSYTVMSQEKEVVRLGEQEFKDKTLKQPAMERTILVCKKFADLASTYGATKIIAVGTSAIREAQNQKEFLQQPHEKPNIFSILHTRLNPSSTLPSQLLSLLSHFSSVAISI